MSPATNSRKGMLASTFSRVRKVPFSTFTKPRENVRLPLAFGALAFFSGIFSLTLFTAVPLF